MLYAALAVTSLVVGITHGQSAGTYQTETHPKMTWQKCTGTGGTSCTNQNGEIVIDANWRWVHSKSGYTNCYTGNTWDATLCPDNPTCTANCVIEGAGDYGGTYGISTSGDTLSLKFVQTNSNGKNIGSRTYLMQDENTYQIFDLANNEFTFTVDVSTLGCGLNGALYFVPMAAKGQGEAGAKYGLGYCDSQCPRDLKWIDGTTNCEDWKPSSNDKNAGVGSRGSCCAELDIWEANSMSEALTPHACDQVTFHECSADNCGGTYSQNRYAGDCDPDGCDFNPYRVGVTDFYGKGMTVDTSKPLTVVTQFQGSGASLNISRYYVQDGAVIAQPEPTIEGITGNVINQDWCNAEEKAFSTANSGNYPFNDHGGMSSVSDSLAAGMVLVMSLWDDHYANMLWLDSDYPTSGSASTPGIARGSCSTSSGAPSDVESSQASDTVKYSAIKFGPIGSTFDMSAAQRKTKERREAMKLRV